MINTSRKWVLASVQAHREICVILPEQVPRDRVQALKLDRPRFDVSAGIACVIMNPDQDEPDSPNCKIE